MAHYFNLPYDVTQEWTTAVSTSIQEVPTTAFYLPAGGIIGGTHGYRRRGHLVPARYSQLNENSDFRRRPYVNCFVAATCIAPAEFRSAFRPLLV